MTLSWLDFDFSGDPHGAGSFEAMASVAEAQWPALQAEVLQVLEWATRAFGAPAPLDEGGEWDHALHAVRETSTPLAVEVAEDGRALRLRAGADDPPRITLTVTLSGGESFCRAFAETFPGG